MTRTTGARLRILIEPFSPTDPDLAGLDFEASWGRYLDRLEEAITEALESDDFDLCAEHINQAGPVVWMRRPVTDAELKQIARHVRRIVARVRANRASWAIEE